MRSKVLVLDEELPIPLNTGKRLRTLNLLKNLAQKFEIHLLVHGQGATAEARQRLEDLGITVHVSDSVVGDKSGWKFPLRILKNLYFSDLPFSVESHIHPAYQKRAEQLVSEHKFALIHVEWTPYAAYTKKFSVPVVISAHNVEAQIWERLAKQPHGALKGKVFHTQAERMATFESDIFKAASYVTAVSELDGDTIRKAGAQNVRVVPNGVDTVFFAPSDSAEKDGNLVFTGSMDWHPNQDAIRFFIDDIYSKLKAQRNFEFFVVGRNPPPWMSSTPPEIHVTGTVPDVRPYIAEGQVYICPLRAGGGSRLKILEALAMQKAVVSTSVGAEGLDVVHDKHLVLADGADNFAQAILSLMADPERRARLGKAGRELVESRYDWKAIAKLQGEFWESAS
ncbi:MAG: glycosyltransferase [Candidatus Eisenbacteria bacterium]|uniref:Glycosyltransferase n=1 Tax=Eiseniibacteriota bacterium TaxID=2212470 RepID=A0A7Y2EAJ3_UNCEI|nr:glycosyltransferase [Candidatus Eisenbacteria bacterium]